MSLYFRGRRVILAQLGQPKTTSFVRTASLGGSGPPRTPQCVGLEDSLFGMWGGLDSDKQSSNIYFEANGQLPVTKLI